MAFYEPETLSRLAWQQHGKVLAYSAPLNWSETLGPLKVELWEIEGHLPRVLATELVSFAKQTAFNC